VVLAVIATLSEWAYREARIPEMEPGPPARGGSALRKVLVPPGRWPTACMSAVCGALLESGADEGVHDVALQEDVDQEDRQAGQG
jgi:hypothetical protein